VCVLHSSLHWSACNAWITARILGGVDFTSWFPRPVGVGRSTQLQQQLFLLSFFPFYDKTAAPPTAPVSLTSFRITPSDLISPPGSATATAIVSAQEQGRSGHGDRTRVAGFYLGHRDKSRSHAEGFTAAGSIQKPANFNLCIDRLLSLVALYCWSSDSQHNPRSRIGVGHSILTNVKQDLAG
jgi:hypothetical protein